jgi:hypothetical protein
MKTHRGIIAMWKTSVFLVVVLFAFLYALFTITPASKHYWESVGPNWDMMLNPNKYKEQQDEGS